MAVSQYTNRRGDISHRGNDETFPAVPASHHQHMPTVAMEAAKIYATYSHSSHSSN